jgi:hypothetical protein
MHLGVCRGNTKDKDHLETRGRSLKDKIKTNLQETECEGVAWIDLAQARDQCQALANKVLNFRDT